MLPKSELVSEGNTIQLRPAGSRAWALSSVHKDSKQANVLLKFINYLWRGKEGKWIFTEHITYAQLFPGVGGYKGEYGAVPALKALIVWWKRTPGRKEAWVGEVDLLGRTVAYVGMCRSFSKWFSVFIWVRIHLAIVIVFILPMRKLRRRN